MSRSAESPDHTLCSINVPATAARLAGCSGEKNRSRRANSERSERSPYEGSTSSPDIFRKGGKGMPWTLKDCVETLGRTDFRYHFDEAERVIRLVFVTSRYRNCRGEHLAVVTVAMPEAEQRLRVSIERVSDVGDDPAATCLAACQFAAAMPLVAVEYDAEFENLRLVSETVIADGSLTQLQLQALLDRMVDGVEIWQAVRDRGQKGDRWLPDAENQTEKAA